MDKLKTDVGKRLAEIRKSKKMNQEEFKELIGAPTVQMISGWENGHSFPSPTYLIIIAKKLDISLDYLLLGKQNGPEDKRIRTYKDAAIYMVELQESGLFTIDNYEDYLNGRVYTVLLKSTDLHIRDFKKELDTLLIASKTLRPELYKQAITDLLNKYDFPLEKKK